MAYAFVNSGTFINTASFTGGTVTYSPTVGNTLIVCASANVATSGLTLSDGHNTYNYLGGAGAATNPSLGIWWCNVTTGGSLTISLTGGNTYGLWVGEYSGLATSAYITSSFQNQAYAGTQSVGANTLTTTSNPNVSSVPAMLFGFCVDANTVSGGNNLPPTAGTSPNAYTARTVGWISTSNQSAVAQDLRFTSTGTEQVTFGCQSGAQFDTMLLIAVAFVEATAPISIAWNFWT